MASAEQTNSGVLASGPPRVFPWLAIAWFGFLLVAAYAPVLSRLVRQWADDPDMGHGFFVPAVAGYIIWQKRGELLAIPAKGTWWGLVPILWGTLQLAVATLGAELFLARTAFLISLGGAILLVAGAAMLRALVFPLLLMLFMVPIPSILFSQITFPLQLLASSVAEKVLSLAGVPVFREGNILELPSQRLSVVEACSGIRSLLSLSFLALVYAHFFDGRGWMKWVLLAAAVPIAIIANAGRVTMTGLLGEYNRELAEGFFHAAEGWLVFMAALVMLVLVHQFISRAYTAAHSREE